jgi:hypothetical protein
VRAASSVAIEGHFDLSAVRTHSTAPAQTRPSLTRLTVRSLHAEIAASDRVTYRREVAPSLCAFGGNRRSEPIRQPSTNLVAARQASYSDKCNGGTNQHAGAACCSAEVKAGVPAVG